MRVELQGMHISMHVPVGSSLYSVYLLESGSAAREAPGQLQEHFPVHVPRGRHGALVAGSSRGHRSIHDHQEYQRPRKPDTPESLLALCATGVSALPCSPKGGTSAPA
ncbi:hypothetical protein NDU88_010621 [Pleurodeles waltl]|uniref:Uncharacterized protein n=1 Tax=Pleurodeles waltl TaxID=8319 RepID=A0AAV7QUV9_PLEWA|nr:hypothetical protein NDU88_010621 [Pleurodeles waltl]